MQLKDGKANTPRRDEPIDQFIIGLKEYNVASYEKFIELYPQLTAGSTFNPFLGFDVVELYEKVVDKLADWCKPLL